MTVVPGGGILAKGVCRGVDLTIDHLSDMDYQIGKLTVLTPEVAETNRGGIEIGVVGVAFGLATRREMWKSEGDGQFYSMSGEFNDVASSGFAQSIYIICYFVLVGRISFDWCDSNN